MTKEKTNDDIDANKLRVEFKPGDKLKSTGASYLKMKFKVNDNFKFGKRLDLAKEEQFDITVTDKLAMKLLDKKDLELHLKKTKFLFGKEMMD